MFTYIWLIFMGNIPFPWILSVTASSPLKQTSIEGEIQSAQRSREVGIRGSQKEKDMSSIVFQGICEKFIRGSKVLVFSDL